MGKPRIPDAFSKEHVEFFKVPKIFQEYQRILSQSQKDVYIYFMIQMKYKKSKWIRASIPEILWCTNIKNKVTVIKAIRELVVEGLIGDIQYQNNNANIYMINLVPQKNEELLKRIDEKSRLAREKKKESIAKGENGKFKKGNNMRNKKSKVLTS